MSALPPALNETGPYSAARSAGRRARARHHRRPGRRGAWIASLTTVAAGLLAGGALVWQASYSAFSSTTANPTNNWAAGTVSLTDDDSGSALFTASNLAPGASDSKCIVVTSNGSLAGPVRLYSTPSSFSQTNSLADYITLTVTQGTNSATTTAGSCANFVADSGPISTTGTLSAFASARTNYANGFGSWSTSGSGTESKVYRIEYALSGSATNNQEGGTAALGFTWEVQNS